MSADRRARRQNPAGACGNHRRTAPLAGFTVGREKIVDLGPQQSIAGTRVIQEGVPRCRLAR
jgi:hypothetical protein